MRLTLLLLLVVFAIPAQCQTDFYLEFKKIESDLLRLQEAIGGLEPHLHTTEHEMRLSALELNFQSLSRQISIIQDSISILNVSVNIPKEVRMLESETSEALFIKRITNFRSFVLAWYDLGEQLEAISATAESILIFPENQPRAKVMVGIGQFAGIGGSIAGSILAMKDPGQGITTVGLSLSITGILGILFKNKQPRLYIENVSRNIAFTDNIHAFERIAATFSKKAGHLYFSVKDHWQDPDWRPANRDLQEFYALINLRKDLNVIVRHMKAKAEHLLGCPLTEEGRKHLNNLVFRYNKALQSWEISEIVYLNTYEFLAKSTQGSFWR